MNVRILLIYFGRDFTSSYMPGMVSTSSAGRFFFLQCRDGLFSHTLNSHVQAVTPSDRLSICLFIEAFLKPDHADIFSTTSHQVFTPSAISCMLGLHLTEPNDLQFQFYNSLSQTLLQISMVSIKIIMK